MAAGGLAAQTAPGAAAPLAQPASKPIAISSTAEGVYAAARPRLLQIRTLLIAAGRQSSLGSGFLVNADGLAVTNYHVVSQYALEPGTYRISIVDVTDRTLVGGPDQSQARGLALGLRLPAVPAGVVFAVVEKKAENGAYSMVSRHPLLIAWH